MFIYLFRKKMHLALPFPIHLILYDSTGTPFTDNTGHSTQTIRYTRRGLQNTMRSEESRGSPPKMWKLWKRTTSATQWCVRLNLVQFFVWKLIYKSFWPYSLEAIVRWYVPPLPFSRALHFHSRRIQNGLTTNTRSQDLDEIWPL